MTDTHPDNATEPNAPGDAGRLRIDPRLKVLYLLAVAVAALAAPWPARPWVVGGLLLLQLSLLLLLRVPGRDLVAMVSRLRYLFVFLLTCYLLLPGPPTDRTTHVVGVRLDLTGLALAALMCGQILTVILASAVVRSSGSETDMVEGLRRMRCPRLLLFSVDNTLALLSGLRSGGAGGAGGGGGGGRGPRASQDVPPAGPSFAEVSARLARGDASGLVEMIQAGIDRASVRSERVFHAAQCTDRRLLHDVTLISSLAVLIMSLRFLKILPGIPFASGLKSTVTIPLYVLAAQLTHSRLGATTVGTIAGLLAFLNGEGRYGVFEVLRPIVPGLLIDALWPLFRRLPQRIWIYALLGSLAAAGNVATEVALALLVGARREVFLFPVPRLVSNLVFGSLSGAVTYALVKASAGLEKHFHAPPGSEGQPLDATFQTTAAPVPALPGPDPTVSPTIEDVERGPG